MANIPICASCGKVTRFVKENYCSDDCLITGLRARVAELERRLNFNTTNGGCEACDATFNAPCAYHQGEIAGKESAESRLTQLEGSAREMVDCQALQWRDGDATPRCICCDAEIVQPHYPDCHVEALRAALTPVAKQEEP